MQMRPKPFKSDGHWGKTDCRAAKDHRVIPALTLSADAGSADSYLDHGHRSGGGEEMKVLREMNELAEESRIPRR